MSRKRERWIRATVIGVGFLSFGIGIARGEAFMVMKKAINICMECIGIG